MSPGSLGDHLAAASPQLIHISWEADPDIVGIGVVLNLVITAAVSLVLLVVSFTRGYRGRSAYRLTGLQTSFERLGITLLDQIGATILAMTLSNISATILFFSTKHVGIRQILIVAVTSVASVSIALRNAYGKASVSAEIAWLESGTDQALGDDLLQEILGIEFTWLFAIFLAVLSILDYRKRCGRTVELACLIAGIPWILFHFAEIKDLYKKYEPYVDNEAMWSFGQAMPLILTLLPILVSLEAYMDHSVLNADTNAPPDEQHPMSQDGEDIPASQNEVLWYFNIFLAMSFVRKVKVVMILVGVAGGGLGLLILLQWYHGNRATVKQTSRLAGRITYFRNFFHYAIWSSPRNVDYAATSLGLLPSRVWFTRARRIPPGYQRLSWKCSCGENVAANFDNCDPHALEALEGRLHGLSNSGVAGGANQGPAISATSRLSLRSSSQGTSTSQGSTVQPPTSSGKGSSANTPTLSRRNATSSNNSQRASIPRYFELCVSVGQHSVSLGEIIITSVATDGQLFSKIWERYHDIKRSSFGAAIRGWFFKPDDVFFVHFGVTKRHQVGIYGKPMEIPPPEEVDQGRYHYFQCPMQPLPPMPDHIFLHYLDHARRTTRSEKNPQAHAEDIFLSRLPKKLGSSIFTSTSGTGVDATISYGWGVHIVERPSAWAQSMVGIASALICMIVFGITWARLDLGTAVGIGQFLAGVLALANAAIYFVLQAYSTRLSRRTP